MGMCVGPGSNRSRMSGNSKRRLWAVASWLVLCAIPMMLPVGMRVAGAVQGSSHTQSPLPIKAGQLMPMEPGRGVYLVKEGFDRGKQVPFTLEWRGDRWLLTKEGLTWHELKRDDQDNILILREADLRDKHQIEYDPPVVLLPAVVDNDTSMAGKTHVTIQNTQTGAVTHRGDCEWHLEFIGTQPLETPAGTLLSYRFHATRRIRLTLAETTVTVDFDYAPGKGMIATGFKQVVRFMGLFSKQTTWRLEQLFT